MQNITRSTPIQSDSVTIISGVQMVPEFIKFVMWFATPRQFRDIETQKEFAESIGVCEDTLSDWKKHPQFWGLVFQALKDWIKERVPDAVGGLYLKATGDKATSKDVQMFLKMAEMEIISKENNNK